MQQHNVLLVQCPRVPDGPVEHLSAQQGMDRHNVRPRNVSGLLDLVNDESKRRDVVKASSSHISATTAQKRTPPSLSGVHHMCVRPPHRLINIITSSNLGTT